MVRHESRDRYQANPWSAPARRRFTLELTISVLVIKQSGAGPPHSKIVCLEVSNTIIVDGWVRALFQEEQWERAPGVDGLVHPPESHLFE